ncbi:MAG: glycosyltransferase family 2 protein [Thermoprotei archaeon]|nr:MAG: glycosyltransferase family 2 protein [Thermoprotei archaeon]
MVEVSIVIPTYNERENIEVLIPRIINILKDDYSFEIIVVDDNSPDGTAELAMELADKYGNIKVIKRPGKLGLSSAILDGVKAAEGTYVLVMDADLQHPPEVVPKLIDKAKEGYDLVIASRYMKGGGTEGWSFFRKLISKGAMLIAKVLVPRCRGLTDVMSGFFIIKRDIIMNSITNLNPRGFKFLLEVIAKTNISNVAEIPYVFRSRYRGKSKLSSKEIINYLIHVLEITPYSTLIKFAIVGASGTVVNLGVLYLLEFIAGIVHVISSAVAIEVSVINNFILNDIWTFRRFRKGIWVLRLLKFHLSSALGLLTQYGVSQALYYMAHIHALIAQFIGILLGFIVNYVISKKFVWGMR